MTDGVTKEDVAAMTAAVEEAKKAGLLQNNGKHHAVLHEDPFEHKTRIDVERISQNLSQVSIFNSQDPHEGVGVIVEVTVDNEGKFRSNVAIDKDFNKRVVKMGNGDEYQYSPAQQKEIETLAKEKVAQYKAEYEKNPNGKWGMIDEVGTLHRDAEFNPARALVEAESQVVTSVSGDMEKIKSGSPEQHKAFHDLLQHEDVAAVMARLVKEGRMPPKEAEAYAKEKLPPEEAKAYIKRMEAATEVHIDAPHQVPAQSTPNAANKGAAKTPAKQ